MKKIWAREIIQGEVIRATCKKLGKCRLEELVASINNLPTQKQVDKLEAKNSFLLENARKLKGEFDDPKKHNQEILDKLNAALLFNQKLKE